jgi:(E)-4-hydroxy-3-methylbut-2-enyl-diphosphate synthase
MVPRSKTKRINIGNVPIGGGAPVSVQSMLNTYTTDFDATLKQIEKLYACGCEIIRLAVPDEKSAEVLSSLVKASPAPLVADIHFDSRLAIRAILAGASAIRINPGNIGNEEKVKTVAEKAGEAGIPIRVGSNTGSLPPGVYEKHIKKGLSHEDALVESLVESSLKQCGLLEKYSFTNIKVSLKSSSVPVTVKAYRKFSSYSEYPLHIGVTEAGTFKRGIIKSAAGIGSLLLDGIGDTLRVSLTAPPEEEVNAGIMILESVGLRKAEPEIVSCPTCGRTRIDLISLASRVEDAVRDIKKLKGHLNLRKIAVMGCVVNGPGEARDADLGITGGDGKILIFKKGRPFASCPESEGIETFKKILLEFD